MNTPLTRRRFGLTDWVLFGLLLLVIGLLCLPRPKEAPSDAPAAAVEQGDDAGMAPAAARISPAEWGIEVVGLYPAVFGRVLDLRYKILDLSKAAELPNAPGRIYLIDEATGVKTDLPNSPRTGSIPQNPQKLEAGRTYSLSFPNPGGHFKSGSQLTLVMGALRAEHLTVQ